MQLTIKQHYVPKFYLKNFNDLLFVYDKKEDLTFKTNPKNIAFEPDFYGPDLANIDSVEKVMADLEKKMSKAVVEIIEKENFQILSDESKRDFVMFLTMQYLRTKQVRQDLAGISNAIINEFAQSRGLKKDSVKLSKLGETGQHLNLLSDWPAFATIIGQMKFSLMINKTPVPFWTSDNPVSVQNEYDQHAWGNMGLTCKGIELHLPLTPKLSLIALDPIYFESLPEVIETYKKQSVIRENFLQLLHSTRFVFSNTKRFHLIKKMMAKNSDLRDTSRTRFTMSRGKLGNQDVILTASENRRFHEKGELMSPLETWMPVEDAEKLFKYSDKFNQKAKEDYLKKKSSENKL